MEGPNHYNVWHMLMEDQTGLFRAMQARQPCDGLPNLICAGNASMRCALLSAVSRRSSSASFATNGLCHSLPIRPSSGAVGLRSTFWDTKGRSLPS